MALRERSLPHSAQSELAKGCNFHGAQALMISGSLQ